MIYIYDNVTLRGYISFFYYVLANIYLYYNEKNIYLLKKQEKNSNNDSNTLLSREPLFTKYKSLLKQHSL